ncbi:MAG: ribonuclease Y [Candidatus Colwellbacteria bacterium]|jgi:ribonuclease Y|nr:ribonuclease Y [Candidatus Colwellbacteria bacterium]MCK9497350.1 ribonuclease Y [Candidatus Colwellbacteria bacterium]MDD3752710.1 ribonuclease Y [Candidatus Colwellbacteria bacterium]MDD4818748.1 ribonuclease Y [Candidatus Colwellbacteria bacterium]
MIYQIALAAAGILAGAVLGYLLRQRAARMSANSIEQRIKLKLEEAEKQSKEEIEEAKKKAESIVEEAKKEERERKAAIERTENRLLKKEELLDKDEEEIREKSDELKSFEKKLEKERDEVEETRDSISKRLSEIGKLTPEEAKKRIISQVEEDNKEEIVDLLKKLEKEKKEEIEKKSLDIITTALQRYSRSHISDITTTVLTLPSEDLKGKIIGREGRNIRTLERITGVEFVIDETPDTILISSFDPVRREIAKLTLEKLIQDGRIQPAKIEDKAEEARLEIDKRTQEIGEEAVYEVGILNLPKEIVHLLGRLNFRTSYGQNVLTHSMEVAFIAGMIAEELGVNIEIAKKGALLHDIGKAIDYEVAGNHVELGMKILKKYDIDPRVIEAMQSHHEDYPFASPEAYIVATADIISAARPGARRGTLEQYVKRLKDLEKTAMSFEGVKSSYAVSAGRELRVFIVPEKIDDFGALQLAKNIAGRIESDMKYPGDIKVTVIREVRAVEYAR